MRNEISIHRGLPLQSGSLAQQVGTTSRSREVGPYVQRCAAFTHPLPRGGTDLLHRISQSRRQWTAHLPQVITVMCCWKTSAFSGFALAIKQTQGSVVAK